jgi:hypothetical protein
MSTQTGKTLIQEEISKLESFNEHFTLERSFTEADAAD